MFHFNVPLLGQQTVNLLWYKDSRHRILRSILNTSRVTSVASQPITVSAQTFDVEKPQTRTRRKYYVIF